MLPWGHRFQQESLYWRLSCLGTVIGKRLQGKLVVAMLLSIYTKLPFCELGIYTSQHINGKCCSAVGNEPLHPGMRVLAGTVITQTKNDQQALVDRISHGHSCCQGCHPAAERHLGHLSLSLLSS